MSVTYEDIARQTLLVKGVLDIAGALGRGDIAAVGTALGRAIDSYPELEPGLLSSTSAGLKWGVEAGRLEASAALELAEKASERLTALTRAEVLHG